MLLRHKVVGETALAAENQEATHLTLLCCHHAEDGKVQAGERLLRLLVREGCRGRNGPGARSALKGEVQERESLLPFFNEESCETARGGSLF
jgi:hypothetical protein